VPSRSNIFKKGSPTSGGLQFFELRRKRNSAGMLKAKHEPTDTEVIAQKILTSSFGTSIIQRKDAKTLRLFRVKWKPELIT
jgi:hypothetical protein